MRLLETRLPFATITVMVQAEVAARLCAAAGNHDYGAITAVLAYYGRRSGYSQCRLVILCRRQR